MSSRGQHSQILMLSASLLAILLSGGVGASVPPVPGADNAWAAQGPAVAENGQVEGIIDKEVSGAIHAIATHPTDSNILYIGAVNGGIWKTLDAASASPTWSSQTDFQSSLSVSALEFDPNDGSYQTLVAGIGRYSSFGGVGGERTGLLRTTNGGTDWSVIDGAGALVGKNISGLAPRGATMVVSVNSADSNNCAELGIFRSDNSGASFSQVGVAAGVPPGFAYDLASDRSNTAVLYTGIIFGGLCSGEVLSNGIYKSTDTGASWAKVSDSVIDALLDNNLVSNVEIAADGSDVFVNIIQVGRPAGIFHSSNGATSWVAMDLPRTPDGAPISISAPSLVAPGTPIAITTTATGNHGLRDGAEIKVSDVEGTTGANGIWTISLIDDISFFLIGSDDVTPWTPDTGTWTKVVGMNPNQKPGSQGGTHASIVIDPVDSGVVYLGGDRQDLPSNYIGAIDFTGRLFRGDPSIAATAAIPSPQWEHLTHSDNVAGIPDGGTLSDSAPHADSREMVFNADGDLIEADDGGIYRRTSPADNTGDWVSLNGNLQITEQHDIAFDTLSDIIISGNQDTGTTQQITPGGLVWHSIHTGDGGDVAVDDLTTAGFSTRFSSFQRFGAFRRKVYDPANVEQSQAFPALAITEPDEEPIFPFVTPLELNVITPTRLVIAGCNAVYESADQGETLSQLDGLFDSMCGTGGILGGFQNAMAYGGKFEGVDNPDVLYVGSGATLWVRTAADPAPLVALANYPGVGQINDIVLDPDDWKTLYVIDLMSVHVSLDAGDSWADITGNLDDTQLRSLAFVPGSPDILVIGGRKGVRYLDLSTLPTGSPFWSNYGSGLPNAPVWDMAYDSSDNILIVGTMGRGAFKMDTVDPVIGPEFDPDVPAGTTLAFGNQIIDTQSAASQIRVDNTGNEVLVLTCGLSGVDSGHFNLTPCSSPVGPAAFTTIEVACLPTTLGPKSATLNVSSNDVDEPTADYPLTCTGVEVPSESLIYEDGFEAEEL